MEHRSSSMPRAFPALAVCLGLLAVGAYGAELKWTGSTGVDQYWDNISNWTPKQTPATGDLIIILDASQMNKSRMNLMDGQGGPFAIDKLTFGRGMTLSVEGGGLEVVSMVIEPGTSEIQGDHGLYVSGGLRIGGGDSAVVLTYDPTDGAEFWVESD
jgi:hypothetical protein